MRFCCGFIIFLPQNNKFRKSTDCDLDTNMYSLINLHTHTSRILFFPPINCKLHWPPRPFGGGCVQHRFRTFCNRATSHSLVISNLSPSTRQLLAMHTQPRPLSNDCFLAVHRADLNPLTCICQGPLLSRTDHTRGVVYPHQSTTSPTPTPPLHLSCEVCRCPVVGFQ